MKTSIRPYPATIILFTMSILTTADALAANSSNTTAPPTAALSPSNPFYAPSTLPFKAPPFDKIKDADFQPAIEAGMAQQQAEIENIANNPQAPTFANTVVAMEKSGQLLDRVMAAFNGVTGASMNPTLQEVQTAEAPKLAAHADFIYLNAKLFARVTAIYNQRASLNLDPESLRLVERYHDKFVHAGANLPEADKAELKKLNEEASSLSTAFTNKLRAATKEGAYVTADKTSLAGLSQARVAAAEQAAQSRKQEGFVIPLQNTT